MNSRIPYYIFIISLLGVLGSLYYQYFGDPVANLMNGTIFSGTPFLPCALCWYARILLYPIALISLVGILKKDTNVVSYILPFSLLGIALEVYHYTIQILPHLSFGCGGPVDCSEKQVEYLGFITIPFLGLIAFLAITIWCVVYKEKMRATA